MQRAVHHGEIAQWDWSRAERITPQFPFCALLIATLLLLPIMRLKFELPPGNPQADHGSEPAGCPSTEVAYQCRWGLSTSLYRRRKLD